MSRKKRRVGKIYEFSRKTAQFEDDFGFYGIKFYVVDIEVIKTSTFLSYQGCVLGPSNLDSATGIKK